MRNYKFNYSILLFIISSIFIRLTAQTIFWKIEKNGKVSYLLGTFHVPINEIPQVKQQIDSLIPHVNDILLELNPKDVGNMTIFQYFKADSTYSLKDLLGEKKYKIISNYFQKELNAKVEQFQSFQPAFLMSLVVSKIALKNQKSLPMDKYIGKLAQDQKKTVIGLETVEEQVKALTILPYKEQAELLYRTVKKAHKGNKEIEKMKRYYLKGKLDYLLKLSEKEWKDIPAYKQALIHDRNKRMVERALPYLEKGNALLAVGALHFPGPDGILSLLQQNGFKITPLPIQR